MWYLLPLLLTQVLALRTLEPPPPTRVSRSEADEKWLNVRLNHFMADNNDTFAMRYYYNEVNETATNIVIFVGGEWAISPHWATGGIAVDLAESLHASVFYTEHRYYGLTRPFEETTTPELQYLNVDQAVGDLAQFIQHVKSESYEYGRYGNASVVLVGCSYAGSMATWMRRAYPHLVDAVVSDSGPLHAQDNFPEYLEVVANAILEQGGGSCVTSIEEAVTTILDLVQTSAGRTQVSQLFNTCTTIAASTPVDLATFFWFGITETFAYLVQAADPGDIAAACQTLTSANVSPLNRLATWVNQERGENCLETRYTEVVAAFTNTSYDAPDVDMRLWTYQTCVEFGWYQTTSSPVQPFGSTVPLEYFHQMCRDLFPDFFSTAWLHEGIKRTNLLFGSAPLPPYTVSVVGTHDPWSPMGPGPLNATDKSPVHLIERGSHCMAIGSLNDESTEPVEVIKRRLVNNIIYFITGVDNGAAAITTSMSLMIGVIFAMFALV